MTAQDDPSGAALAQAAHDAGAVTPPVDAEPIFDVTIACVVGGSRFAAEEVGATLEVHAERMRDVGEIVLTISERT